MRRAIRSTAAALFVLLATGQAAAQTVPPAGNIEARTRDQLRPAAERDPDTALMTGDTDILLLRRPPLFSLNASIDVTRTSNAYLAPTGARGDFFAQAQLGAGVGTRIAGRFDVFASAGVVGVRYFKQSSLDYSAFSGAVGARAALGPAFVTALYQPSIVFDRDFARRQLTSHRFRLAAALPLQVRGVGIEPEIHGERAITHPSDYSAWSGGGSLTASRALSRRVPVLVYAQVGYDHRSFDDYFTAFIGTRRIDDTLSAGAGVLWRPRSWGEVRASYSFARNRSTSDVNGYTAHSGTVGVTGSLRF